MDFSKLDTIIPDATHPVRLEKDCLNMVMVGSFRGVRSHSFICEVADALNRKGFPFNLYFVGRRDASEYHLYDRCVEYCNVHGLSGRVHFMGNRSDIPYLLKQMDLFLYASNQDTFGIAVLEAMAAELPVIVNDWAVMKEITDNGTLADLYQTGNVEDCLSKILSFQQLFDQDKEKIEQKSRSIAHVVRERYSIEKHIQNLNSVYLSFK